MAVLVDPVDAERTAALVGIEGAAAFGAVSLAFLRFTKGPWGAATVLGAVNGLEIPPERLSLG